MKFLTFALHSVIYAMIFVTQETILRVAVVFAAIVMETILNNAMQNVIIHVIVQATIIRLIVMISAVSYVVATWTLMPQLGLPDVRWTAAGLVMSHGLIKILFG